MRRRSSTTPPVERHRPAGKARAATTRRERRRRARSTRRAPPPPPPRCAAARARQRVPRDRALRWRRSTPRGPARRSRSPGATLASSVLIALDVRVTMRSRVRYEAIVGFAPMTTSVGSPVGTPTSYAEWLDAYGVTPERDAEFTTLSGEPVRPLYTEADLPEGVGGPNDPIGLPGRLPLHARDLPLDVPRHACGRCASSPASAPPRRPTSASATCSTTARRACRPRSTCRR